MLLTSVILLVTALIARRIAIRQQLPGAQVLLLTLWHTATCVAYWYLSQDGSTDADFYYQSALSDGYDWNPGTRFVISFTKLWIDGFNTSNFNAFLIFNIVGLAGLLLLAGDLRTLWPRASSCSTPWLAVLLPFMPGLSFWSSAIGKDAPAFLASCLAAHALLQLSRRKRYLFSALLIMVAVRPHMAIPMVAAGAVAALLDTRVRLNAKLAVVGASVAAAAALIPLALNYSGIGDISAISDIENYVSSRQNVNTSGGSSIALDEMSLPGALLTYLFRPLFFDAPGVAGVVVSIENLIYLLAVAYFGAFGARAVWHLRAPSTLANVLYVMIALLMLALTTANLGIAIRQKTMILPQILILIAIAAQAIAQRQRSQAL